MIGMALSGLYASSLALAALPAQLTTGEGRGEPGFLVHPAAPEFTGHFLKSVPRQHIWMSPCGS